MSSVRWALMIAPTMAYALSALCFWRCRLHFIRSVEFIRDGHPLT